MSSTKPKFTVVTVVYNGVTSIEETILSVINQKYHDKEYIIIDGGSTDGTLDVIRRYESKITRWVSEKDKGIYDAMNKGIAIAQGEWINFMNSGDKFFSEDVLGTLAAIETDCSVLFGDAMVQYTDFQTKFPVHPIDQIWRHTPFCHQASFSRSFLLKKLMFDTAYRVGSDYDFFYRAFKEGAKFEYVPVVICLFEGRTGTTNNYIRRAYREKMQIVLKYDYTFGRLVYYNLLLLYVNVNILAKKILGENITKRIVRYVRRK